MNSNYEMKTRGDAIHITGQVHTRDLEAIATLAEEMAGRNNLELDTEIAHHFGVTLVAAPPSVLIRLRQEHLAR